MDDAQSRLDHLAAAGHKIDPADVDRLSPLDHPTINLQCRYRTTSPAPSGGVAAAANHAMSRMGETADSGRADRGEAAEPLHAGEQLQRLRVAAGMTVAEVAERAGVDADWLRRLEAGEGTHDVFYSHWVSLVRATQPPRPEWWDDGYEHDLSLPPDGHREPTTDGGRRYWARVAAVAAEIEDHYSRGRPG